MRQFVSDGGYEFPVAVLPDQVPVEALSDSPSTAEPVITGRTEFTGAGGASTSAPEA